MLHMHMHAHTEMHVCMHMHMCMRMRAHAGVSPGPAREDLIAMPPLAAPPVAPLAAPSAVQVAGISSSAAPVWAGHRQASCSGRPQSRRALD